MMKASESDFDKFDSVVGKLLSVSHKELQEREKKYKKQRKRKKRTRASPASHGPAASA